MIKQFEIGVLGELKVRQDGQPVPLPHSRKTRALLAYLAVVGRSERRDHLCRMFWGVPDDPRASLRWSLHKIRQVTNTGDERLTADRDTVVLDPRTIDLDFRKVMSHRTRDLDAFDADDLVVLAECFRGEFLEDLCLPRCPQFEAWRIFHRDAVLRRRIEILRLLGGRLRNKPERARFYAHELASLDRTSIAADTPGGRWRAPDPRETGMAESPRTTPAPGQRLALRSEVLLEQPGRLGSKPPLVGAQVQRQEIRFCRTPDSARIAYAVSGRGPPIVRAAHWMSHLQHDWESPVWRHWIDALSDGMTLIRYDERGNGLSDWDVREISFSAMVSDLESIIDAAGLDRFTLLGVSQSCAVSVAYAVRHPERVSGLILYGGFVKGWRRRGDDHEIATHEAMTTLIREGWGKNNPVFRHLFTEMFIPGASAEQMRWFDELQRITVLPENACRLHEAFGEIDVSGELSRVTAPTLVLHARHDAVVPFHSGREFAIGIPGARFVDLDSANHILLASEPAFAQLMDEVRRFAAKTSPI